jgi:hypothetical protein
MNFTHIRKNVKRSTGSLLIIGAALVGGGYAYQHFAFQSSDGPGQASVTVFVKDKSARVFMQADVKPVSPSKDSLTIDVTGARGKKEQWLLVVQCPSGSDIPAHEPLMKLYTESGERQPSTSFQKVLVWKHTGNWSGNLGCFTVPATSNVNVPAAMPIQPGGPASFLNATLLSLEADPAAQQNQLITPLYAEQNAFDGKIRDLVEVLQAPNLSCPSATPSPAPTPSNGTRGSPASKTSPPPRAAAGPSPDGASPDPAATASPISTPSPISAVCYNPVTRHTTASEYQLPTSVETTETLENANLSGYRIDSIFPPEQITPDDRMIWKGVAGLSPSISATSLSVERNNNRSLFISGILFGIAGAALVPVAQEFLALLDGAAAECKEEDALVEPQPLEASH